jgi:hypothetical protein
MLPELPVESYAPEAVPLRPLYHRTGMAVTIPIEVAVVRSHRPRKCSACGHKRVLFALTFTTSALGNPEVVWRCAPDWGLRETV